MSAPREVLFRDLLSFRHFVDIYTPTTAAAETLVRKIKADPRFPRELASLDAFKCWVRHGPRMPYDARQAAAPLWAGYAAWRRRRERQRAEESAPASHRTAAGSDPAIADAERAA